MKSNLLIVLAIISLNLFTSLKIKDTVKAKDPGLNEEFDNLQQDYSHVDNLQQEDSHAEKELSAIDEERDLDKLNEEVESALEHEDLIELENQPKETTENLNNEADAESKEIEKELKIQNGVKDNEEDDNELEID